MSTPFVNPFVNPTAEYQRDINVLKTYAADAAQYLHLSTGKPIEECQLFIKESLKSGGQHAFVDPKVTYLQRGDNGDRVQCETTLSKYLGESLKRGDLIAPTLTTYLHPSEKQSLLGTYIAGNIKARSKAKKEMFAAKAAGDHHLESIKKIEQTNRKLANNAISGAHVSPSTPLYNKTAHSTLTSNCRTTSGYGNANNEKLLSGNRHYFNHHVVLNNIVSITNNTNYDKLQVLVYEYQLHLPSVQETMACIAYSSRLYWWENHYMAKIEALVSRLSPMQRAAFVYTGDLYHLKVFNPELVRRLVQELSTKVEGIHPDPLGAMKRAPDDHINLAHQICAKEAKGLGKIYSDIKDSPTLHTLALTTDHIAIVLTKYANLIKALFVTTNVPASVAHFPDSIRRAALTSDTDSTIFTVQDWVLWYKGTVAFDDEAIAVAATMIFLASSTITHILAMMSANFGIVKEHLHSIAMKNEFKFDVFVPTQLGKHYFAAISCQEGFVFDEHETEIKGVGLKSSNAPREIIAGATAMMEEIMHQVMTKGSLSLTKYLTQVADVERAIISSIQKGETTYLRSSSIKDAASYTATEEVSPYQQHVFWNEVFGEKYGIMPPPPYATLKVSVTVDTPVKFKKWLASLKDRQFAGALETWMKRTGKTCITTLNLPAQCLQSRGLPSEISEIINYAKIVGDIVRIYYMILECLGVYSNGDKVRRLVSSYY